LSRSPFSFSLISTSEPSGVFSCADLNRQMKLRRLSLRDLTRRRTNRQISRLRLRQFLLRQAQDAQQYAHQQKYQYKNPRNKKPFHRTLFTLQEGSLRTAALLSTLMAKVRQKVPFL
jgi:hypothetical protein